MARDTEYQFVDTTASTVLSTIIKKYESLCKVTVQPASPERLFCDWAAAVITQLLVDINYTANQNIPSRAEGDNLDALAQLVYQQTRPDASASTVTMRMTISEAQESAILIPAGTRVTDTENTYYWATDENVYITAGDTYADVSCTCQTTGTETNGFAIGQITELVDVFDYYLSCENITESDGGSDVPTDDEFYELMRASMDAFSVAGPHGAYIYFAKQVSSEIADVVSNSPTPGYVYLYVLMNDGTPATDEVKDAVYEACSADDVRPLTDYVVVSDPEQVEYNIDLTYYIPDDTTTSAANVQAAVEEAVNEYIAWQYGALGRDINPSKLYQMIMETGIKRIELREPEFTVLRDGALEIDQDYDLEDTVPQVATVGTITIVNGGYEDE